MAPRYPAIPEPTVDPKALMASALALKETVEIATGTRGDRAISTVTWQDLVDLQLILPNQIPSTPSNR